MNLLFKIAFGSEDSYITNLKTRPARTVVVTVFILLLVGFGIWITSFIGGSGISAAEEIFGSKDKTQSEVSATTRPLITSNNSPCSIVAVEGGTNITCPTYVGPQAQMKYTFLTENHLERDGLYHAKFQINIWNVPPTESPLVAWGIGLKCSEVPETLTTMNMGGVFSAKEEIGCDSQTPILDDGRLLWYIASSTR